VRHVAERRGAAILENFEMKPSKITISVFFYTQKSHSEEDPIRWVGFSEKQKMTAYS
jgi:hypothetical protein